MRRDKDTWQPDMRYNVASVGPSPARYVAGPRSQQCVVVTWLSKPGGAVAYSQARYLTRGDRRDIAQKPVLFGPLAEQANRVGQRYGQQRIIISPLKEGIDLEKLAHRCADDFGLDAGWYAVVHRDTDHPHIHLIAETEKDGRKLVITEATRRSWEEMARARCTAVMGPWKGEGDDVQRKIQALRSAYLHELKTQQEQDGWNQQQQQHSQEQAQRRSRSAGLDY